MVQLGNLSIPLEKSHVFKSREIITQTDYENAILHIHTSAPIREAINKVRINDGEHKLHQWITTEKGVYVGTWAKRWTKLMYKEHGIKLDPQLVSIVSERIAKAIAGLNYELKLEFSNTPWRAGDFGESSDSCWFDGRTYSHSRQGIHRSDQGGAIKIYTVEGYKRARCWFWNVDKSILIFNAYDRDKTLDILTMARIVSNLFNMDYYRHPDVVIDTSYINGRNIYAIGDPPIRRPVSLDFAIRQHHDPLMKGDPETIRVRGNLSCTTCGRNDGVQMAIDGKHYCKLCSSRCIHCREWIPVIGNLHYTDTGNMLCPNCVDAYEQCPECEYYHVPGNECTCTQGFMCASCEEMSDGEGYMVEGQGTFCETCMEENAFWCERCEHYHENDDGNYIESENQTVCNDCYEDHYFNCERCHDSFNTNQMVMVEEQTWCTNCRDNYASLCDHCDEMFFDEHVHEVYTEEGEAGAELWCEGCITEDATTCEACGETYADGIHTHEEDE